MLQHSMFYGQLSSKASCTARCNKLHGYVVVVVVVSIARSRTAEAVDWLLLG